jgi:hypothetical protein
LASLRQRATRRAILDRGRRRRGELAVVDRWELGLRLELHVPAIELARKEREEVNCLVADSRTFQQHGCLATSTRLVLMVRPWPLPTWAGLTRSRALLDDRIGVQRIRTHNPLSSRTSGRPAKGLELAPRRYVTLAAAPIPLLGNRERPPVLGRPAHSPCVYRGAFRSVPGSASSPRVIAQCVSRRQQATTTLNGRSRTLPSMS